MKVLVSATAANHQGEFEIDAVLDLTSQTLATARMDQRPVVLDHALQLSANIELWRMYPDLLSIRVDSVEII